MGLEHLVVLESKKCSTNESIKRVKSCQKNAGANSRELPTAKDESVGTREMTVVL